MRNGSGIHPGIYFGDPVSNRAPRVADEAGTSSAASKLFESCLRQAGVICGLIGVERAERNQRGGIVRGVVNCVRIVRHTLSLSTLSLQQRRSGRWQHGPFGSANNCGELLKIPIFSEFDPGHFEQQGRSKIDRARQVAFLQADPVSL